LGRLREDNLTLAIAQAAAALPSSKYMIVLTERGVAASDWVLPFAFSSGKAAKTDSGRWHMDQPNDRCPLSTSHSLQAAGVAAF
jgi:hypothetical protein